jgi:hypothetical protein
MDYGKLPVTALLRGPLLSTPQGRVVLLYLVAYLAAAALVWLLQLPPPIGKTPEVFIELCIAWPFIVFLMFVRDSSPTFAASWATAAWLILYGALPVLFRIYDTLRT